MMNEGADERRRSSISLLLSCTNQSIVPAFDWFYWEDWESWEEMCLSVLFTWTRGRRAALPETTPSCSGVSSNGCRQRT